MENRVEDQVLQDIKQKIHLWLIYRQKPALLATSGL